MSKKNAQNTVENTEVTPKRTRKTVTILDVFSRRVIKSLAEANACTPKQFVDTLLVLFNRPDVHTFEEGLRIAYDGIDYPKLGIEAKRLTKSYKDENAALKAELTLLREKLAELKNS